MNTNTFMNADKLISKFHSFRPVKYAMPYHEYANCLVCYDVINYENGYTLGIFLKSYNTVVCGLVKDTTGEEVKYYRFISGLYSRTTIKHICWFCTYIDTEAHYYGYKELYNNAGIEEVSEKIFDNAYRKFH